MDNRLEKMAADLAKVVKGDVFTDILHRTAFGSDASIYQIMPLCVIAPRDRDDVVAAVKYAAANGIAMAARGAGSGLAGEALCSGIVFDMTRYMNKIISVAEDGGTVVCEPGVVLDELNGRLTDYKRKIGPDPSSANRATVGGIVANNSTGAHSLEYGHIAKHVESIEAVLADGSVAEFGNDFSPADSDNERLASIAQDCICVLGDKEAIIAKTLPKTKRNRSGYNIAGICHDGKIDLARLMAGSEGTLAIFTKITLRTVKLPASKGLLQLEFESLDKMAKAVPIIVESGASTCELMDKNVINMALDAFPEYRDILPKGVAAVLLIERDGATIEEVQEKIGKTDSAVGTMASGRSTFFDLRQQKRIWKSRKDAVPLLYRGKSKKRPVEFMEDVSVDNTRIVEYLDGLEKIKKKYDISMSYYGHAGDGELHIRPNLDLGDPADLQKMRSIAEDVFELAWSLGGSISGEHADGLLRAAFIKRQYGEQVYELLCEIKNIFDPNGLMNPGKIINSDADIMTKNMRVEHKFVHERLENDVLIGKEDLAIAIEQCNGCGVCLSREADLRMCPVYRAMGEELGSSRAKNNLLRAWATGQLTEQEYESAEFRKFLDLCVNCKACSLQCPTGVDTSKLMMMARAEYVRRKGLRRTEGALSNNRYLSLLGSLFWPISNFVTRLDIVKWVFEKFGGFAKSRSMPAFGRGSFIKAGRKYMEASGPVEKPIDKVAYFVDTYANYNDHELGFAVLEVLRANDIEVILPEQLPAPLPAVVYGDVKRARKDLKFNAENLAKTVREGYKIICSEPSAALCLKEDLRHFVESQDAKLVSENTYELMSYLLGLFEQGKLKAIGQEARERLLCRYAPRNDNGPNFVYHYPCHLLSVGTAGASIRLLEKLCGLKVEELKAGCCGLAGTFGMQKKNYELSQKISEKLRQALASASTKFALTECGACKMQIEHISDRVAIHPIKILSEAYKI